MKVDLSEKERDILISRRVARLATVNDAGKPHVVPVCFVFDGSSIFTPIDVKPKRVPYQKLKRIKNIYANPNVSFVVDEYSEDWIKLFYILISGTAEILFKGGEYNKAIEILSGKYSQYEHMGLSRLKLPIIRITPDSIVSWGDI